ncbi:1-phosphatidylinositol 4-kinase STT4 NDAI_0D02900 [Naumovozyma dairenensis CBS 421]|uniref:1-phosphatidylinositol 4-kinase n=1 Tax=Naumovozyma dairenensis (strain ATCC 10597 / BCRC 20456 / CBS 421 / NBRC 0211 / NRRL Y-12639) TaxID=1071378 RepID=G0W9Z3_NAUDC|nr:hypothetical protein NDAI_0D02900 [Naumovozyma dairenensis CBS 421]CCD24604.1 hypothetical protein NDAI_0D02900 [Naumovozyma dairenensis CBS 421]
MRFYRTTKRTSSLRARALEKLAQLSLNKDDVKQDESLPPINGKGEADARISSRNTLGLIMRSLPISYSTDTSRLFTIPLTLNEWELLSSISQVIPDSLSTAEELLDNLISPYFLESSRQRISDVLYAKFKLDNLKNPNELLTFQLTKFLIAVSSKHPKLIDRCSKLIDGYLSAVKQLYSSKQSSLLSLLGFMNGFIQGKNSPELATFVWKRLSSFFIEEQFTSQLESILSSSSTYVNDVIVQYFEAKNEICGSLYIQLLSKLQSSFICDILDIPPRFRDLSSYLLEMQHLTYQITQEDNDSDDKTQIVDEFTYKIRKHKEVLTSICEFSLRYCQNDNDVDLSTDSRAIFSFDARGYFINCLCLVPFIADPDSELFQDFIRIVADSMDTFVFSEIITDSLIISIISAASLLNYFTEENSLTLLRIFPLLVSSQYISTSTIIEISKIFTIGLQPLNEDSIVSTIYSLNNLLIATDDGSANPILRERKLTITSGGTMSFSGVRRSGTVESLQTLRSAASSPYRKKTIKKQTSHVLASGGSTTYHGRLFKNCVTATTTIASHYNKQSIRLLAFSILSQKITAVSEELDEIIPDAIAKLSTYMTVTEFSQVLKFFKAILSRQEDGTLFDGIINAKTILSTHFLSEQYNSELYRIYLRDLLETIISCGEVEKLEHHRPHTEISRVAEQISSYLGPLAALLPKPGEKPLDLSQDEQTTNMLRNVWFNMVIHGFHYKSKLVNKYKIQLLTIAYNSPPLASDFPANNKEMSLEMNTILRRGSSNANVKEQKQAIVDYFNVNAVQSRTISLSKIMFLAATTLLETLRCEAGDCSKVLLYFSDPSITTTSLEKPINILAVAMIAKFSQLVQSGDFKLFNSKTIALQLNNLLLCLAHRNPTLQESAFHYSDLFIRRIPSSLCHHQSLYTLLDLLTALFDSVVDCETNKFEPHYKFILKHSRVEILLPGSSMWRTSALSKLHKIAKQWVQIILNKSAQDTKILLQTYVSDLNTYNIMANVDYGISFAMELAGMVLSADVELSKLEFRGPERPNTVAKFISQHSWRSKYLVDTAMVSSQQDIVDELGLLSNTIRGKLDTGIKVVSKDVTNFLDMSAALLILGNYRSGSLLYDIVHIPFEVFTSESLKSATNVWLSIIKERRDLAHLLLVDVTYCWLESIKNNVGVYSRKYDLIEEEYQIMTYKPYNKKAINREANFVSQSMQPHRHVIKFFLSHFEGTLYQSKHLLAVFTKCALLGVSNLKKASLHPFSRMIRNELLIFAILVLIVNDRQGTKLIKDLCREIVYGGLTWFYEKRNWPFGSNELKIKADLSTMKNLYDKLNSVTVIMKKYCNKEFTLLMVFLESEIEQVQTWLTPLDKIDKTSSYTVTLESVKTAFTIDPRLAVSLSQRYPGNDIESGLVTLINQDPLRCVNCPIAIDPFIINNYRKRILPTAAMDSKLKDKMHIVLYWKPVSPLKSINLFLPQWNSDSFLLQYSVFSLESHDVNVTFFYVPQIVQCLRYDKTGYVERLIFDTAKINILFSHQIIWNLFANCYKDDEGTVPDDIKPTLDRVRERMVSSFDADTLDFYKKEFGYFNEVTSISGKLKPYIKKSKAEKKHKIDEEMNKIVVKPGVYLPSNPDGVVIDIDRKSGKPLQSHAKAPFMATFKIRKDIENEDTGITENVEKWQGAIFKVGDDCRQDVLALQLISMFKTIWSSIGLDVYVFPYRVTATAPGCGVIDVLPNSISRDMLGREAVNGLYEYFITKFGSESTIEFQNARNNFVKSLAGYSVISYLLQFKDRHNGNIMYDDKGHCLHTDFGFIFDIVPGGVKFEAVPFKLTKEMVKVMGGSSQAAAYQDFEELCIKAYLSARPHMDSILECVKPMLESGLPCFKGEKTIKNLRNRFQPERDQHEAALFMRGLIKKSYESLFTKGYDEFQRLTNGIPY